MEDLQLQELRRTAIVQATTIGIDTRFYEDLDFKNRKDETKNIIEIMERCIAWEIDPWRVDVVNFALIVRELTNAGLMSIAEAGYIIYRSWGIVYVQANDLMENFGNKEDENSEEELAESFVDEDNMEDPDDNEFISLKMPVKHHEMRKVMLVELIEVMRKTERNREKITRMPHMEQMVEVEQIYELLNSDEPEKDLESVFQKIMKVREPGFFMEDEWGETTEEKVKFFIYSMFIRKNGAIKLAQECSYDRIWIEKER
ncbi:MAG: hypothetical protein M1498_04805 [Candidatus Thermoplasmatota archaeon]|nr:hypothetical protein [Candidatus Thermoplasmatota archaeon]